MIPVARPLAGRVAALNARIRAAADRHDVALAETDRAEVFVDRRLWSADRLHASPLGHARIAAAVAHALELPGSDDAWRRPLPTLAAPTVTRTVLTELGWISSYLGPWLGRRLRGRSSGDGRTARRPHLLPVRDTAA